LAGENELQKASKDIKKILEEKLMKLLKNKDRQIEEKKRSKA